MSGSPPAKRRAKLRHLPKYRTLLCVSCNYCVFPLALERHLKCIHHLYKRERDPYVNAAQKLTLARHGDDVLYPEPEQPPIPGLPIYIGYACSVEGCSHLCVTSKRMQAHRRAEHSNAVEVFRCRSVKMQTFFRASALRYFIVTSNTAASSPEDRSPPLLRSLISETSTNETSMEWLLIRHFCEYGYHNLLPVKGTQPPWRDQMLQVCLTADFLRYAILSATASHIAYSHIPTRNTYSGAADWYRQLAIKTLPAQDPHLTDQCAFFAQFNFQRLMTICCISRARAESHLSGNPCPEWVPIQRRGRAAVWRPHAPGQASKAMHGPAERLIAVAALQVSPLDLSCNPYDSRLSSLACRLESLESVYVNPVCLAALSQLRRAWAVPYRESVSSFRDMALMFTARAVPQEYIDLLQQHDPAAVIVWAHYCVLWSLGEVEGEGACEGPRYWYMKGHAEKMLLRCVRYLGWEWQNFIAWPIEMVLES